MRKVTKKTTVHFLLQFCLIVHMGPQLHSSSPIARSPKQKRRKLKVISLNCNGIKSPTKKAEFQALIDQHKPDIVVGCESKLDSTMPTYFVFPSTYEIFRKDRSSHGGGVFIGIRNDIIATKQVNLSPLQLLSSTNS